MKQLVSTKGNTMFQTPLGEEIAWNRISLVTTHAFVQQRIGSSEIILHATNLPDTATDAEWVEWLKESDGKEELAVASFVEAHKVVAEGEPEPEAKTKPKAK